MDQTLQDNLVCPVCTGRLLHDKQQQALICQKDRLSFPILDDTPIMRTDWALEIEDNT